MYINCILQLLNRLLSNLFIILNVGSSESESISGSSATDSTISLSSFDSGIHDSSSLLDSEGFLSDACINRSCIYEDSSGFSSDLSEAGITNKIIFENYRMIKNLVLCSF